LEYKGRHETIMAPGHYTQLFFLDEATALAAGHRPCALCRRNDFIRFVTLWQSTFQLEARPKAAEVDRVLHDDRLDDARHKRRYESRLADLPPGTMIEVDASPLLWLGDSLRPWTPSGYLAPIVSIVTDPVQVLTPRCVVLVLAAGYQPLLHETARSISKTRSS
jgi:hypothetical protein